MTLTAAAGGDIITSTSTNLAAQPGVFFSTGNDTVTATAGTLGDNDILVDSSTTDSDVLNAQLVATYAPANVTNIERLNFELLADANINLAGASGYNTIGLTGANRTTTVSNLRDATNVQVGSNNMTVGLRTLTDLATNTATVTLNGVTGVTLNNGAAANTNDIDVLSLVSSGSVANTATLLVNSFQQAGDQLNISGSQALTLTATDNLLDSARIASTNTGVDTINIRDTGAAAVNATNVTGIDAWSWTDSNTGAAPNTLALTNVQGNIGLTINHAITDLTLSSRTAGSTATVTALADVNSVNTAVGANLTTVTLNANGVDFNGALTVNLAPGGGTTPTLVLTGTGVANQAAQTITINAGSFDGSGYTVNRAAPNANDGLIINGSAAGQTIVGTAKNDTITGGAGNDVINLTTGGNDQVRFAHDGAANVDTVNGFTVGATTTTANNDFIGLTAGAFTGSGLAATTFAAVDIGATAAGAVTVYNQAVDTDANLAANTSQVMKLTSVVSTSWATAMGTSSLNVADGAVVTAIFFDATNGQAVVGIVDTETDNAVGDVLTSADTFVEIARIGMTAADYANFGTNQILFF